MKKIGIITCSREPNYGACLQAFATQQILEKMGCQAEILNYTFEDEKSYQPLRHKNPKTILACMLFYGLRHRQYLAFDSFHKKMSYSERCYKKYDDFKYAVNDYDILITGSDQVWNPNLGIDIGVTLQEFHHSGPKKVSYASSFGISDLNSDLDLRYKKAFSEFSALSVREKNGQEIVLRLLDKQVPVVLDPTMLFSAAEWDCYAEGEVPGKPYILLYDMRHSKKLINFAQNMAQKNDCTVLALSRVNLPYKNVKTLSGITPGNMLTLFRNAACVVTDSFHGTVFSILYHKPFYVQCAGEGEKLGSRIKNLLDCTGLSDRLLIDYSVKNDIGINFESVDKILEEKRIFSINWLKKAVLGTENIQNDE